jgi:hypothetical protein
VEWDEQWWRENREGKRERKRVVVVSSGGGGGGGVSWAKDIGLQHKSIRVPRLEGVGRGAQLSSL